MALVKLKAPISNKNYSATNKRRAAITQFTDWELVNLYQNGTEKERNKAYKELRELHYNFLWSKADQFYNSTKMNIKTTNKKLNKEYNYQIQISDYLSKSEVFAELEYIFYRCIESINLNKFHPNQYLIGYFDYSLKQQVINKIFRLRKAQCESKLNHSQSKAIKDNNTRAFCLDSCPTEKYAIDETNMVEEEFERKVPTKHLEIWYLMKKGYNAERISSLTGITEARVYQVKKLIKNKFIKTYGLVL